MINDNNAKNDPPIKLTNMMSKSKKKKNGDEKKRSGPYIYMWMARN